MNTKTLLALSAAALFATCTGSLILSHHGTVEAAPRLTADSSRIVDLPAVKVAPAAEDLAYFQAHTAVTNMAAVQVRPDPIDLAYYQARVAEQRIVNLAVVTVRPAAEDLTIYLAKQAANTIAAN
ncbi:MAG: hypothetical protein ABW178_11860 [Pseudoxanthomonas sp.]